MEDPKNLKSLDDGKFVQKDRDVEIHRKEEEEKRKLQENGRKKDAKGSADTKREKNCSE